MLDTKSISNNLLIISIILLLHCDKVHSLSCQDNNCKICSNYNYTNTCIQCNTGFYISSKNQCIACPPECKTCTDKCIECINGYFLTKSNICGRCPNNCDQCKLVPSESEKSTKTYCAACNAGYYLQS